MTTMDRSDFLMEHDTYLEIVFLEFVFQHLVGSARISHVPVCAVSTCCALGLRKGQTLLLISELDVAFVYIIHTRPSRV